MVDLIIHLLADAKDPLARGVADVLAAVEHVGNRRRGNARALAMSLMTTFIGTPP